MLTFKYCECGCHGHEASPGGRVHFWILNDLEGGFFLHRGHGRLSPLIGKFDSFPKAVRAATKEVRALAKQLLKEVG